MPWRPNPLFVGRETELAELARQLNAGGAAAIAQAPNISGMGGLGKTQLAVELVWRIGRDFPGGVFWLSFADANAIPAEIAECGTKLGLHEQFSALAIADQMALVTRHWQDGEKCLLVFDNCEDPALFERWRPQTGNCRVLLTSRRADWPAHLRIAPLVLPTLPRDQGIALLQRFRPDLTTDDLAPIADFLGNLPLALHLAGSYLAKYESIEAGRPDRYLVALRDADLSHPSLALNETNPTGHESHVARTFLLSWEKLGEDDDTDSLARALLTHAAHLAPGEPIPFWLQARIVGLDDKDGDDQRRLIDATRRLTDLGLIDIAEDGALLLHRLIAAFARNAADDAQAIRATVEDIIADAASAQNKSGLPGPLLAWQAHLRHVADSAADCGGESAGRLCNSLGYHLDMIADYPGAKAAYERALAIDEKSYGPDHPNVAILVNNLGSVLKDLGDLNGAKDAFERALVIDEKTYGPDHPNVARDINNLGSVLKDLGDLDGTKDAFERARAILEKAYGPDHPRVAAIVNNLGSVLKDLGDLSGAKDAFERALAIDEKTYGPDHPNVAGDINNFGSVLKALGDLDGAKDACQRALIIFETTYGPDHPQTLIVRDNLATLKK